MRPAVCATLTQQQWDQRITSVLPPGACWEQWQNTEGEVGGCFLEEELEEVGGFDMASPKKDFYHACFTANIAGRHLFMPQTLHGTATLGRSCGLVDVSWSGLRSLWTPVPIPSSSCERVSKETHLLKPSPKIHGRSHRGAVSPPERSRSASVGGSVSPLLPAWACAKKLVSPSAGLVGLG